MTISTKDKNRGHPPKYIINIGDVFGDLQCIDIFFNEKTRFTNYKMKCLKYRGSGITHKALCKNVQEFSRNHNLDAQSIYDCLTGDYKQTRGYKFIPMDR